MADGFRVDFDTRALLKVAKKYTRKGGKMRTLLEQAGERVERNTFRRIGRKQNVDGSGFKELSKEYKKRKTKNKNKILVYHNTMVPTLTWAMVSDDEVRVGFGDEKAKFLIYDGSGREPLGVSDTDVQEIAQIAEDILDLS
jgi:hypothetical protein